MGKETVVSNTTPLIALAWLEQLDLLPKLFGQVHIPQAVFDETRAKPGAVEIPEVSWLILDSVKNAHATLLLSDQLDAGESEAIVLAQELEAGILLMDERRGRRRAIQSGLTVTGTLGILIEARLREMIEPLRPYLEKLRLLPFRMSDELFEEVLRKVGE
jgi:predicted nucleic acid-binding protein